MAANKLCPDERSNRLNRYIAKPENTSASQQASEIEVSVSVIEPKTAEAYNESGG
jgi:hypothetical protein